MSAQVWQIAGGPSGRSYTTVFLRHGIGLIGPGDPGAWNPSWPDGDLDNSSWNEHDLAMLRDVIAKAMKQAGCHGKMEN